MTCNENTTGADWWLGSAELLNFLNLMWMKAKVWLVTRTSGYQQDAACVQLLMTARSRQWVSRQWVSRQWVSRQWVSSVVDEQSPNALDADRDSVEEFVLFFHSWYISLWDFLCRLYLEWIVNKCKNTKLVHSIRHIKSESNFIMQIN